MRRCKDDRGASRLDRFSAPTRAWFAAAFAEPTPAQAGAWEAISQGRHALVVAPTGSGKTLSAFLWSLDRLLTSEVPAEEASAAGSSTSPRSRRSPSTSSATCAPRWPASATPPSGSAAIAARGHASGCAAATPARPTAAGSRTTPPDILITTPESLFLMLTSQARESLRSVETVILDEVHAVAGTKRGAHLALSLERLDALLDRPAQRIGLSRDGPPARGGRPLPRRPGAGRDRGAAQREGVGPPVVVPVEDMTAPEEYDDDGGRRPGAQPVDLAPRRGARRRPDRAAPLDHRLRQQPAAGRAAHRPAQRDRRRPGRGRGRRDDRRRPAGARSWRSPVAPHGAPPVLAKAHHGSVSKEQRALIEDDLKRGRLPAVVATSSLELGIDMGAVDLVVQIESPPSVASALQRVGRAGHQVGEVSRGRALPQAPRRPRPDRGRRPTGCARARSRACGSRPTRSTSSPSRSWPRCALDAWDVDELYALVRRSAAVRHAPPQRLRRHPRPARRPLPLRRVRRAPPAHRLGPRHRQPHRPPRRPAAGRHQRRHHPRPRPLRRLPRRRGHRPPGRRARRGDGLRVAGRRRVRARRDQLADRGHHPRPGAGHPRAGHPGPAAVLEGRRPRPARRARRGRRRVHPRARRAAAGEGDRAAPAPTASTRTPPATSSPTSPSRSRRPAPCPAT